MARPLSGKSAPKGRVSLIERFGGTVETPAAPKKKAAPAPKKAPATKKQIAAAKKPAANPTPAPVAGTKSGAAARAKAFAANEEKMQKVRATLAAKKK